MTLYEVALSIREVGQIWLIEFPTYGTLFRVDIGKQQARIVIPKPGQSSILNVPVEKNSALYLVTDLAALRVWLRSLSA